MAQAKIALDTARALLDDPSGTLWTDAVLLPHLQKAHTELVAKLAAEGVPVTKTSTVVLSVPTNTKILNGVTNFPTDMIEPIKLWERYPGETDEKFVDIVEASFIPKVTQSNRNSYWAWESENLELLGALVPTEIQMRYTRSLVTPTSASSNLGFIFGELFIGPRTAAIAASTVGNTTGKQEWDSDADESLDDILAYNVKGQQNTPARARPYHRRRFGNRTIRGL